MRAEPIRLVTQVERAWESYIAAARTAQQSQTIEDGIEAGRAWARFISLFLEPSERETTPCP